MKNVYITDYNNYSFKSNNTVSTRITRLKAKRSRERFFYTLISLLTIIILTSIFIFILNRAIGIHFDNQDIMLCESAKVSGNEEYLEKCQPYYNGENIRSIHGEEVTK